MAKQRIVRRYAAAAAMAVVALTLGGCGGSRLSFDPTEWFSGSSSEPSGTAGSEGGFTVFRGSAEAPVTRAITAADLVGADGRCEGGSPGGTAPRAVGLTMTECELVTVAGVPEQVNIGAGEGGGRRAVLTYGKGDHPGIYTFVSGRLKIIERLPTPPKPEPRRRAPAKKQQRA
jgi:hypothetical protein